MAGEERSDAPGRASADPRGLEDSSPATHTTYPHIVHLLNSLLDHFGEGFGQGVVNRLGFGVAAAESE